MSMVNFDENQIIANGAKIYDQRAKIEAIADSIVDNGFDYGAIASYPTAAQMGV